MKISDEQIDIARKILQKEPTRRFPKEIQQLVDATEHIQFFQNYQQDNQNPTHKKCCQFMKYEFHRNGKIVFEIDSVGDKFYIILRGKVGIFVRTMDKSNYEKFRQDGNPPTYGMLNVKTLQDGDTFGELALINNRPRMATISCLSDCEFAILQKKEFNQVLKEQELKRFKQSLEFFDTTFLSKNWEENLKKYIYLNQTTVRYTKDQTVFSINDDALSFYIIKTGDFLVKQALKIKRDQEQKEQSVDIIIKQLGPSEFFGEEEIVQRCPRRYTVVCESIQGELVCIKSSDFLNKIYVNHVSKSMIDEVIESRMQLKQERMENIKKSINQYKTFLLGKKKSDRLLSQEKYSPENHKQLSSIQQTLDAELSRSQQFLIKQNSRINKGSLSSYEEKRKIVPDSNDHLNMIKQEITAHQEIDQIMRKIVSQPYTSKQTQMQIMKQNPLFKLQYQGSKKSMFLVQPSQNSINNIIPNKSVQIQKLFQRVKKISQRSSFITKNVSVISDKNKAQSTYEDSKQTQQTIQFKQKGVSIYTDDESEKWFSINNKKFLKGFMVRPNSISKIRSNDHSQMELINKTGYQFEPFRKKFLKQSATFNSQIKTEYSEFFPEEKKSPQKNTMDIFIQNSKQ